MPTASSSSAALRWPMVVSSLWLASLTLAGFGVLVVMATVPQWWSVVRWIERIATYQTGVALACCVGLLILSKPKHAEVQAAWSRRATIWVLGGLLSALVLQVGVLPQWLAQASSVGRQMQVLGLWALQWLCAGRTLWLLLQWRRHQAVLRQP